LANELTAKIIPKCISLGWFKIFTIIHTFAQKNQFGKAFFGFISSEISTKTSNFTPVFHIS